MYLPVLQKYGSYTPGGTSEEDFHFYFSKYASLCYLQVITSH